MPRIPREKLNTNYFHVMVQGINKSYIFQAKEDIQHYIKIFKKIEMEHNVEIITYCVMQNHSHFLIWTDKQDDLSNYMKRINLNYAIYYNKKYNRVGYVFRDRFKSQGIFSYKQYCNCVKYILENPIKAGICTKIFEYPYLYCKNNWRYINIEKFTNNVEMEENFIDIEEYNENEINDKDIIFNYIKENDLKINERQSDLIDLVKYLHNKKISYRRMEKVIKISREKLRKLSKL